MLQRYLSLIALLIAMTIAGYCGWRILESVGMALMFALLVGVTIVPPFARLAEAAKPSGLGSAR